MKLIITKIIYIIIKIIPNILKKKIYDIIRQDLLSYQLIESKNKDYILNLEFKNIKFKLNLPTSGVNDLNHQYGELFKMRNGGPTYELMMMHCLINLINKEQEVTFLDIGSYLGYYSVFTKKYNAKAKVFSIESNPHFCKFIKKSLINNDITEVNVDNIALSNNSKPKIFYKNQLFNEDTLSSQNNELTYSEINNLQNAKEFGKMVNSRTLDQFIESKNIYANIIKIDVHASEGYLLEGSKKILKDKNFDYILLELHPDHDLQLFSKGYTRLKIINTLINNDLCCLIINGFRSYERSLVRKQFLKDKKITYKLINSKNMNNLLYGQDIFDIFLLIVKDINKFKKNKQFVEL